MMPAEAQRKLVAPLLIVLVVAVGVTVARVKANLAQSSPPAPPVAARHAADNPAADPEKSNALPESASLRNPFDPSALGAGQPAAPAPEVARRRIAPRVRPGAILPPATITISPPATVPALSGSEPVARPEKPGFRLNAILRAGDTTIAILCVGASELRAVRQGQVMEGGYRIVYIGEGFVRISGPDQEGIRLSLPGSEIPSTGESGPVTSQTSVLALKTEAVHE